MVPAATAEAELGVSTVALALTVAEEGISEPVWMALAKARLVGHAVTVEGRLEA